MSQQRPILTITGSDPSGASGIQADIRIISALGGRAVSAITSLTVQNTLGIQEFHDLPATVVRGQMEGIMNDLEPQTVKIGMIRTRGVLQIITDLLIKYRPHHVIYVPVTTSAQGEQLVPSELADDIEHLLVPLCTLVVPHTLFKSHGDANTFASATAYYLNEGFTADEALRRAQQLLDAQPTAQDPMNSRSTDLYHQFLNQLEKSFSAHGDVHFYADLLNVTDGYLAQVTRRMGGMSPKALIDQRLTDEARHLLTSSSLSIKEIAYRLGFGSQAHFSKFFRKQMGTTPTIYRRESRTKQ